MKSTISGTRLARDLRTALVAVVAATLVTATPSIAAKVKNADKVDGKHAVGAKAKPAKRAGKLVATDRAGRLPNDIIAKAPDADRLDGLDAAAFRTRIAAPGELMTGILALVGATPSNQAATVVTFPAALAAPLPSSRATVVPPGGSTAQCPGVGQVAVNGWLCVYEAGTLHVTEASVFDPATTASGVNPAGFELQVVCEPGTCILEGTWAARAP